MAIFISLGDRIICIGGSYFLFHLSLCPACHHIWKTLAIFYIISCIAPEFMYDPLEILFNENLSFSKVGASFNFRISFFKGIRCPPKTIWLHTPIYIVLRDNCPPYSKSYNFSIATMKNIFFSTLILFFSIFIIMFKVR